MPPSEADLVARCAAGDEQALGLLYDTLGRPAYALALRIVRSPEHAQEVVQEAFLDAWRSAAAFDPARGRVASFLFTFVHRRAVDLVRREQVRPRVLTDPASAPEPVTSTDLAADVAARDEGARVRAALHSLPAAQREVLELAYFGGLSQSEVAERIGEPIGTVKSRTHTALARLRQTLEGDGG